MEYAQPGEPNFPKWVSGAAVNAWREARQQESRMIEGAKARPSARKAFQETALLGWRSKGELLPAELFQRLLTEQAKSTWSAIKKKTPQSQFGSMDAEQLVAHFCIRGFWGAMFEERMTRAERKRHRAQVKKAANGLAKLLHGSDLDRWLALHIHQMEQSIMLDPEWRSELVAMERDEAATALLKRVKSSTDWFLSSMSLVLHELGKYVDSECPRAVELAKPGDENARRVYFIKTMTGAFYFIFGQLMRNEVAAFTCLAFDCDITEREVRRIAPREDYVVK